MRTMPCPNCVVTLEFLPGENSVTCRFCRGKIYWKEIPQPDDFILDVADRLCNEMLFTDAQQQYRSVLSHSPSNPRALWGMVKCAYGVQIVCEDGTNTRFLICNIRNMTRVQNHPFYMQLMDQELTASERAQYEADVKYIDSCQSEIDSLAREGTQWDVYLCYKENERFMDGEERQSVDSEWVQDVYTRLRAILPKDTNIFYAPIALYGQTGSSYAAGIANALATSRVMLLLCSKAEYFETTWIKSEYERFLRIMDDEHLNRIIIPVYRGMYGMRPEDFPAGIQNRRTQCVDYEAAPETCLQSIANQVEMQLMMPDPKDHYRRKLDDEHRLLIEKLRRENERLQALIARGKDQSQTIPANQAEENTPNEGNGKPESPQRKKWPIIKCKMCGGNLAVHDNSNVCECESCGTKQTVPNADNEKKTNLLNRANRLRMDAEFDKAAAVYTSVTAEFPEEAEAYWGLCLCKYGIEYVNDPATGKKIPACHRILNDSILDDADFEQACEYADSAAKGLYREEAKAIQYLQQEILNLAAHEEPYDVFICCKETDENDECTEDSVLAQEIYDSLIGRDMHVFFAGITLGDKPGKQYEPYIYAALQSSRVMLVVGTHDDSFDAVRVRNEWTCFLDLMKTDQEKTLIPCFKNLDIYDMPKAFRNLQAQDMGNPGWLQELTQEVEKLCGKENTEAASESPVVAQEVRHEDNSIANLMERVCLFLEDGDTSQAEQYIEKVLDEDAEYAPAYMARVLIRFNLRKEEELLTLCESIDDDEDWQKALRFASEEQRKQYDAYAGQINENRAAVLEAARQEACERALKEKYSFALQMEKKQDYALAIDGFAKTGEYQDSKDHLRICMDAYRRELIETADTRSGAVNEARERVKTVERFIEKSKTELLRAQENNQKRCKEIPEKISRLTEELSQVKGLFRARKRWEIESNLDYWKRELNKLQKKTEEAESIERIESTLKEAEQEREDAVKALEAAQEFIRREESAKWTDEAVLKEAFAKAYMKNRYGVGNRVTFGRYSQTKDGNDDMPIEWIVLDVQGDRALLLSLYGLDAQPYHTRDMSITWKKCTLRTWLNGEFFKKAFTAKEQGAILTASVDNSMSQGYSAWWTSGGKNTDDKLFLLSYAEANKYLGVGEGISNIKSRVAPTAYAIKNGAYRGGFDRTSDGTAAGRWWLRSPGLTQNSAAYVCTDGSHDYYVVNSSSVVVRPAFWLNLEADIF